ncbi:MAG: lysozyme [Kordiimonadaceae bacterium]|nr:lysozyme [Kordiimonadaceae bacterium]
MTNYFSNKPPSDNIWDQPDYPWGDDFNRDMLKIEYDRRLARELGSKRSGIALPSNHAPSSEMVQHMKNLQNYQQPEKQPIRELVLNNSSNDDNVASMIMSEPQRPAIDPAILSRADQQATGYKPIPERQVKDYATGQRIDASKLRASDHLRNHIRKLETYVPKVSDDGYGNSTGGFGHTEGIGDAWFGGMDVSRNYGNMLFDRDLAEAERTVKRLVGNLPLRQNEYDALVDLAFNVGAPALNLKNSPGLNKAIIAGDYAKIGQNLIYTKANNQFSSGLGNRSKSRIDLYTLGVYARRYD